MLVKSKTANSTKKVGTQKNCSVVQSPSLLKTLKLIHYKGPLSQTLVAQKLDITNPAVYDHFQRLESKGLIMPVNKTSKEGKGRPRRLWDIDKARNFTVGFCFVPPMLIMGMSNFGGTVLLEEHYDLSVGENDLNTIVNVMDTFIEKANDYIGGTEGFIRTLYIGQSGEYDTATGKVVRSINLPSLENWDSKTYFSEKYGIPTYSFSHNYAFHWGEIVHLPPHVTATVVDWDLGLGVITGQDEHIYTKQKSGINQCGILEFGHMKVVKNGRHCICGREGCLEAYVGGWALLKELNRPDVKNLSELCQLAEYGDEQVLKVLSNASKILGENISWVVRFLGSERIIVTGPLSRVFPIVKHAFCEGLKQFLDEDEVRALRPLPSSNYLGRIAEGACFVGRHLFFCPEDYM